MDVDVGVDVGVDGGAEGDGSAGIEGTAVGVEVGVEGDGTVAVATTVGVAVRVGTTVGVGVHVGTSVGVVTAIVGTGTGAGGVGDGHPRRNSESVRVGQRSCFIRVEYTTTMAADVYRDTLNTWGLDERPPTRRPPRYPPPGCPFLQPSPRSSIQNAPAPRDRSAP